MICCWTPIAARFVSGSIRSSYACCGRKFGGVVCQYLKDGFSNDARFRRPRQNRFDSSDRGPNVDRLRFRRSLPPNRTRFRRGNRVRPSRPDDLHLRHRHSSADKTPLGGTNRCIRDTAKGHPPRDRRLTPLSRVRMPSLRCVYGLIRDLTVSCYCCGRAIIWHRGPCRPSHC
jgi:hypothetical protein